MTSSAPQLQATIYSPKWFAGYPLLIDTHLDFLSQDFSFQIYTKDIDGLFYKIGPNTPCSKCGYSHIQFEVSDFLYCSSAYIQNKLSNLVLSSSYFLLKLHLQLHLITLFLRLSRPLNCNDCLDLSLISLVALCFEAVQDRSPPLLYRNL